MRCYYTKFIHNIHFDQRRYQQFLREQGLREHDIKHFKGIFDGHGQGPTKGLIATQPLADGEPSLSTNWPYCTALSTIRNSVLVSKLFSKRPEHV
jgi:hypothetical protein